MKKTFFTVILIFISLNIAPATGQNTHFKKTEIITIQNTVLLPFLEALKKGDTKEIKKYLSSDTYKEYKRLLEENKKYPEFLRNYYKDADFSVLDVSGNVDEGIVYEVMIEFPNGSTMVSDYKIKEYQEDMGKQKQKKWRITKNFSGDENRTQE